MIREAQRARPHGVEIARALARDRAAARFGCRRQSLRIARPRGGKNAPDHAIRPADGVDFRVERRGVGSILGVLQQRIALKLRLDESRELLMGQLQQLDGLQQLRRHRQRLPLPQLQPLR